MFRGHPSYQTASRRKLIPKFCLEQEHSSLRLFLFNVIHMASVWFRDSTTCSVTVRLQLRNFDIRRAVLSMRSGVIIVTYFCLAELSANGQLVSPHKSDKSDMISLCTKCPPISTSMIIGPASPSSSLRGGKDMTSPSDAFGFSVSLLDVMYLHRVLDVLCLMEDSFP
ncbi:hypothetical protein Tco_0624992 [Tanacetum coccineum]|uniref:Uncharacterized protein n=1 Tax=Tanacetum coccineum TaxID=301880 RepID=A0ABQ4WFH9_9ASTR